jgi:hypothetical protein
METSVVSYLTARPTLDMLTTVRQRATQEWWEKRRKSFDVFISRLVWKEAEQGDDEAAKRRLKILKPLRWLQVRRDTAELAQVLVRSGAMPEIAKDDALHIALAATHGMDFLLTWNFTHINNAATEEQIKAVCEGQGSHCPVICTPDQLGEV